MTNNTTFLPVLLGSDMNAYGMARSFHEEYGIKSLVLGRLSVSATGNSKILNFREIPQLDEESIFIETLLKVADEFKGIQLILLACGDDYAKLIINNKEFLSKHFIVPYIDKDLMEQMVLKENFYKICDEYEFPYPKTVLCTYSNKDTLTIDFEYPIIIKPSNSVTYLNASFPGKKKVFVASTEEEKNKIIEAIYQSTYKDNLTIQEYIPGDDSQMRVLNAYVGKDKKVKLLSLGNPILEEHTPGAIGNYAAIMCTFEEEIMTKIKTFLEDIGYTGFANFDMKYDERDGQYKLFEINLRNGRSSYYVTAGGYNLMKYVVDDYIYNKNLEVTYANNEHLWLVIPKGIINKYVQNKNVKNKAMELISNGKYTNSLFYKKDFSFTRWVKLILNNLNYYRKYKKHFNKKGLN